MADIGVAPISSNVAPCDICGVWDAKDRLTTLFERYRTPLVERVCASCNTKLEAAFKHHRDATEKILNTAMQNTITDMQARHGRSAELRPSLFARMLRLFPASPSTGGLPNG